MTGTPSGSDAVKRHFAARVLQRKAAQAPNGPMPKSHGETIMLDRCLSALVADSPSIQQKQHHRHAAVHHHESSFNITVIVKLHLALLVTVFATL